MSRSQGLEQGPEIIFPGHSSVFLPDEGDVFRLPRSPDRRRNQQFNDQFESKALFYDCFSHHNGSDVLLVGPPPLNLLPVFETARFVAQPSGKTVTAHYHPSRSTMITRLANVPVNTTHIALKFGGTVFEIPVQPSLVEKFAGSRILFTMNKNNDLAWITDWAHYHAAVHQTDTIVLFDNGSNRYGLKELETTLGAVPGLKKIVLFSWPYKFGRTDLKVYTYHYWAHFLQISSMNLVLRRFGLKAAGLLNCDIDELVAPIPDSNIYQIANASSTGVEPLVGKWVEVVTNADLQSSGKEVTLRHGDYQYVRRDPTSKLCPKKWALDPQREWVNDLETVPYWHRIMGAPRRKPTGKPVSRFWHFHGISTNWKQSRRQPDQPNPILHHRDTKLVTALNRLGQK